MLQIVFSSGFLTLICGSFVLYLLKRSRTKQDLHKRFIWLNFLYFAHDAVVHLVSGSTAVCEWCDGTFWQKQTVKLCHFCSYTLNSPVRVYSHTFQKANSAWKSYFCTHLSSLKGKEDSREIFFFLSFNFMDSVELNHHVWFHFWASSSAPLFSVLLWCCVVLRASPTSRLITRTVSGAPSPPGPRGPTARTRTGMASTATGTADPTTAGEHVQSRPSVVSTNKTESHRVIETIPSEGAAAENPICDVWLLGIASSCLTVPHFPNELH